MAGDWAFEPPNLDDQCIVQRADGRFGYSYLPLYWSEPGRYPFLVCVQGKLAGLVLVKKGSEISGNETVWDMAEFVLRGYRRRGIGTQIAHEVWRRFQGLWEVRVMESNGPAHDFWAHAIPVFAGEAIQPVRVEKDGKCWTLFSFESKRPRMNTVLTQWNPDLVNND